MKLCLKHVAKNVNFPLPDDVAQQIVDDSDGNLRRAILCLEALKTQS